MEVHVGGSRICGAEGQLVLRGAANAKHSRLCNVHCRCVAGAWARGHRRAVRALQGRYAERVVAAHSARRHGPCVVTVVINCLLDIRWAVNFPAVGCRQRYQLDLHTAILESARPRDG